MTIDRRIFIVGCPRSGTTLLQSLLASHTRLTSFTESHFFDQGIKRPKDFIYYYISKKAISKVKIFLAENHLPSELEMKLINLAPNFPRLPGTGIKAWMAYYQLILDSIANSRGKENWIEKTPDHLNRVEIINRYISNPLFIHIVRNPLDTVASLYSASRKWGKYYSIKQCVNYWNKAIRKHHRFLKDENTCFISYEYLAHDPRTAITKIVQWLAMDMEPDLLSRYKKVSKEIIAGKEDWKKNNTKAISPRSTHKTVFTNQEIAYIRNNVVMSVYQDIMDSNGIIR